MALGRGNYRAIGEIPARSGDRRIDSSDEMRRVLLDIITVIGI